MASVLAEALKLDNYLTPSELSQVLTWGDSLTEGNESSIYKMIYKWEALCISVLITQDLYPLGNFQQDLIDSIIDDFPQKGEALKQALELLLSLYKRCPHKVSQAYGLYRLWGHPVIDPARGVVALQRIAKQYRHGDTRSLQMINGKFAETFIKRYWRRHGFWPNVDLSNLGWSHPIQVAHRKRTAAPTLPRDHLPHWGLVKFMETFPIDPKLDILEMLSDKSMSLGKTELIKAIREKYNIGFSEARSVLVQWLKTNLSDPEVFLRNIDLYGFPKDEVVVGVCPKEREGKVEARMFGLLTLYKRMYVILTGQP